MSSRLFLTDDGSKSEDAMRRALIASQISVNYSGLGLDPSNSGDGEAIRRKRFFRCCVLAVPNKFVDVIFPRLPAIDKKCCPKLVDHQRRRTLNHISNGIL